MPGTALRPLLAITQGDPAGIGPETLAKLVLQEDSAERPYRPLLIAERAAFEPLHRRLPALPWDRLHFLGTAPSPAELEALDPALVPVLDPVAERRTVEPGKPGPQEAHGALAALDAGIALAKEGSVAALVTAPVAKEVIARHRLPGFVGHTEYLAEACGLSRYGRDYLMAFLAPELQVALLSTHLPLREALSRVEPGLLLEALECLSRHGGGRIAVAGFNPHAGEGGLLGWEDAELVAPAVAQARRHGLDVHGPESADSLFARARSGQFDWVLALYHDQGLIAVKTACFGTATNWTLGLPFLRTSVDHGTAFSLAGLGVADERPLAAVVAATLELLGGSLPRRRAQLAEPAAST
ncbi:MAG: 4-hydroxythreonine-4-phosphate dehydrogenase PdxA [Thermoanaerobaculia bacterium]